MKPIPTAANTVPQLRAMTGRLQYGWARTDDAFWTDAAAMIIERLDRQLEEFRECFADLASERDGLWTDLENVTTERDDARQALCIWSADGLEPEDEARRRGWDCFTQHRVNSEEVKTMREQRDEARSLVRTEQLRYLAEIERLRRELDLARREVSAVRIAAWHGPGDEPASWFYRTDRGWAAVEPLGSRDGPRSDQDGPGSAPSPREGLGSPGPLEGPSGPASGSNAKGGEA